MSSFWEAWQPRPADVEALRTPNPHLPFPATSPLLILPGSPVTPLRLPLFGATCTSTAGVLAPDQPLPDAAAAEDVCLFVGGPVWALAWCPHSLPHGKHAPGAAHEAAVDFLALACHPPGQPQHTIGAPASGPAAVQVWALPRPGARGGKGTPLPPSLHCILPHDGGVTWGLAWCPDPGACLPDADPGSEPGAPGRLGLLAACGKVNNSFSWRGAGQGALWTLCVEPRLQLVAYGGEDGVVGVFAAGFQQDNRKRSAHHPVAGFQFREGALHVLDPGQLAASHGLYAGKSVERLPALKGRPFPPEAQAVTRMAWHPNAGEKWGRLATGCWAGMVRVQTIYRR